MSFDLDNLDGPRAPASGWEGRGSEQSWDSARSAKAAQFLKLRLYVAAHSVASRRARRNLERALDVLQPERLEVEVIDADLEPERAAEDGVRVTPFLVRLKPEPRREMGGALDNQRSLLALLSGLA